MVEIRLKRDCSCLALVKNGDGMVKFGKNGRLKNYELIKKISQKKIKFPVYYIGEWSENEQIWMGELSYNNPNSRSKK